MFSVDFSRLKEKILIHFSFLFYNNSYKITIDKDRNSAEEINSTNDYWKIHLRSIKDLFFKAQNNDVFDEFKGLMPGDIKEQSIKIKVLNKKMITIYIWILIMNTLVL